MAALPRDRSVGFANILIDIASQAQAIRDRLAGLATQFTDEPPATYWSQMATFSLLPDGSAGTADATPNPDNPISVGGLNCSANQLGNLMILLNDFQQFLGGDITGVTPAITRNKVIDQIVR